MTNLIHKKWKQYYQLPVLPEETERSLSLAAFRYYAFLWREANVRSAVQLVFSTRQISNATGISRNRDTLKNARLELERLRLVRCDRELNGVYRHTLLDEHGQPLPPPKDRRGVALYDPDRYAEPKTTEPKLASPEWES